MDIPPIRLFLLTAKHLNITQAARELHISQSAASRQLHHLQTDVGIKLLKRRGRGIELTNAGRRYLNDALPILAAFEELQRRYRRSEKTLTIAAGYGISTYRLPAILAEFARLHAPERLVLRTGTDAEIKEWLLASEVDLAIVATQIDSPALHSEPYCDERLTAFVPNTYPFVQSEVGQTSGEEALPFVIKLGRQGQSFAEAALRKLAKKGIRIRTTIYCESHEAVKEAVRHGAGIGILFHDVVEREIARGEFKTVAITGLDSERRTQIVYANNRALNVLAKRLLFLLRSSIGEDAPREAKPSRITTGPRNGRTLLSTIRSAYWWVGPLMLLSEIV